MVWYLHANRGADLIAMEVLDLAMVLSLSLKGLITINFIVTE